MTIRFAIIENNKVSNIALADEPIDSNWIQSDTAGIGDSYDGTTFTAPVVPTPTPIPEVRRITKLAFINRFTDTEAITIDLASQGTTVQAAAMRRYQAKVNAAAYIDLTRQDTRDGVLALEAAGILGSGRALIILDGPINPTEKFTE